MGVRAIRKQVREFAKAFMYVFLRDEVGLVPSIDSFVTKVEWNSSILDFFSAEELLDEFLKWSGVDEEEMEGVEWPDDVIVAIEEGSREGLLEWLRENVDKFCRDEDVLAFNLVEAYKKGVNDLGYVIVIPKMKKEKVKEYLLDNGYDKVVNVYEFKYREDVRERDFDKWEAWLRAVRMWRKVGVRVVEEEIEEMFTDDWCVKGMVKELVESYFGLEEGLTVRELERGVLDYMRLQPAKTNRIAEVDIVVRRIQKVKFLPFWGTGELHIYAETTGSSENRTYFQKIVVEDFGDFMSEEWSEFTPIRLLDGKTMEEFYIGFINPNEDELRVWCTCRDFMYTFWEPLKRRRAIAGPFKAEKPKGTGRKPRNVAKVPGACKHILALIYLLMKNKVISTQWRAGKVIDIARRGLLI